ncbi:MAG: SAM-dependent chlorinase/fluorinase [Anaerolineae bacterium]|nr:SAM-dependent chlorinase/fluorinase [Anaerolineae bacterium]
MNKTIALLTDFGLSDSYVGVMKGVMLSICPSARLIDLTHAIQPQNIRQAAYVLLTAYRYFSPDTVFLIVVDPGVGTPREPIAVQTHHGIYVAPDNGVLSYVLAHLEIERAVMLHNPDYHLPGISHTFHGRDIFSPAAAHLANGTPITELGPPINNLITLNTPVLAITSPRHICGEVLHIDHFGNIITSIGFLAWTTPDTLELTPQFGQNHPTLPAFRANDWHIIVGSQQLKGIRRSYGAVPPGTLAALVGSSGQLEIGVNQGSAAQALGVTLGDPVALNRE